MAEHTVLLPCPNPWCADLNTRSIRSRSMGFFPMEYLYWVRCRCGVCAGPRRSRELAITAWNTRAVNREPAFEAMREALLIARANLQFLPPNDVMEQIDAALALAEKHKEVAP